MFCMRLACVSRASRVRLACVSRVSRVRLACVSRASRVCLGRVLRVSQARLIFTFLFSWQNRIFCRSFSLINLPLYQNQGSDKTLRQESRGYKKSRVILISFEKERVRQKKHHRRFVIFRCWLVGGCKMVVYVRILLVQLVFRFPYRK